MPGERLTVRHHIYERYSPGALWDHSFYFCVLCKHRIRVYSRNPSEEALLAKLQEAADHDCPVSGVVTKSLR